MHWLPTGIVVGIHAVIFRHTTCSSWQTSPWSRLPNDSRSQPTQSIAPDLLLKPQNPKHSVDSDKDLATKPLPLTGCLTRDDLHGPHEPNLLHQVKYPYAYTDLEGPEGLRLTIQASSCSDARPSGFMFLLGGCPQRLDPLDELPK